MFEKKFFFRPPQNFFFVFSNQVLILDIPIKFRTSSPKDLEITALSSLLWKNTEKNFELL